MPRKNYLLIAESLAKFLNVNENKKLEALKKPEKESEISDDDFKKQQDEHEKAAKLYENFASLFAAINDTSASRPFLDLRAKVNNTIADIDRHQLTLIATQSTSTSSNSITHLLPTRAPATVLFDTTGLTIAAYDKEIDYIRGRLNELGEQGQKTRRQLEIYAERLANNKKELKKLGKKLNGNASNANLFSNLLSATAFCAGYAVPAGPYAMAATAALFIANHGLNRFIGDSYEGKGQQYEELCIESGGMRERAGIDQLALGDNQQQQTSLMANWDQLCLCYGTLYDRAINTRHKLTEKKQQKKNLSEMKESSDEQAKKAKEHFQKKPSSESRLQAWQTARKFGNHLSHKIDELGKDIEKLEEDNPNDANLAFKKLSKDLAESFQKLWRGEMTKDQEDFLKTQNEIDGTLLGFKSPGYVMLRQAESLVSLWIQYERLTGSDKTEDLQQKLQMGSACLNAMDQSFYLLVGIDHYVRLFNKEGERNHGLLIPLYKTIARVFSYSPLGLSGVALRLIYPTCAAYIAGAMAAFMIYQYAKGQSFPVLDPVLNAVNCLQKLMLECTQQLGKQIRQLSLQNLHQHNELIAEIRGFSDLSIKLHQKLSRQLTDLEQSLSYEIKQGFCDVNNEILGLRFHLDDSKLKDLYAEHIEREVTIKQYSESNTATVFSEQKEVENAVSTIRGVLKARSGDSRFNGAELAESKDSKKTAYLINHPGWRSVGLVLVELEKLSKNISKKNTPTLASLVVWVTSEFVFLCDALEKHGQRDLINMDWMQKARMYLEKTIDGLFSLIETCKEDNVWLLLADAYRKAEKAYDSECQEIEKAVKGDFDTKANKYKKELWNYHGTSTALVNYKDQAVEKFYPSDTEELSKYAQAIMDEKRKYYNYKKYRLNDDRSTATSKFHYSAMNVSGDGDRAIDNFIGGTILHGLIAYGAFVSCSAFPAIAIPAMAISYYARTVSIGSAVASFIKGTSAVFYEPRHYGHFTYTYKLQLPKGETVSFKVDALPCVDEERKLKEDFEKKSKKRKEEYSKAIQRHISIVVGRVKALKSETSLQGIPAFTNNAPPLITIHKTNRIPQSILDAHEKGLAIIWGEWVLKKLDSSYELNINWYYKGRYDGHPRPCAIDPVIRFDKLTYDFFLGPNAANGDEFVREDIVQRFYIGCESDAAFGVPCSQSYYVDAQSSKPDHQPQILFPVEAPFVGMAKLKEHFPDYIFNFDAAKYNANVQALLYNLVDSLNKEEETTEVLMQMLRRAFKKDSEIQARKFFMKKRFRWSTTHKASREDLEKLWSNAFHDFYSGLGDYIGSAKTVDSIVSSFKDHDGNTFFTEARKTKFKEAVEALEEDPSNRMNKLTKIIKDLQDDFIFFYTGQHLRDYITLISMFEKKAPEAIEKSTSHIMKDYAEYLNEAARQLIAKRQASESLEKHSAELKKYEALLRSVIHLFIDNTQIAQGLLRRIIAATSIKNESERKDEIIAVKNNIVDHCTNVTSKLNFFKGKLTSTAVPAKNEGNNNEFNTLKKKDCKKGKEKDNNNQDGTASAGTSIAGRVEQQTSNGKQNDSAEDKRPKTKWGKAGFNFVNIADAYLSEEPFFAVIATGLQQVFPSDDKEKHIPIKIREKCAEFCYKNNDVYHAQLLTPGSTSNKKRYFGSPQGEGRLICTIYAIKIHLIEEDVDGVCKHCFITADSEGSEKKFQFKDVSYSNNIIHILKKEDEQGKPNYQLLEHDSARHENEDECRPAMTPRLGR